MHLLSTKIVVCIRIVYLATLTFLVKSKAWLAEVVTFTFFLNRSMERILFGKDYFDKFNPQDFLQTFYSATNLSPIYRFKLNALHTFYQSYPPTAKLRILDIGSGPVIANIISAASHAAEIVLSEYTEANRAALLQWLNNDPNAFDWTHILKYVVVDIEGKTEEEVPIQAELVRKVVKAVVPCDANQDPPIPSEYVDEYDIVTDFLCLVSACATTEDYAAALIRLHALLKPGGKIVLYTPEYGNTLTPVSYPVGPYQFFDLPLTRDFILKSLEQAGFSDVKRMAKTREELGLSDNSIPDVVAFSFITASKMN